MTYTKDQLIIGCAITFFEDAARGYIDGWSGEDKDGADARVEDGIRLLRNAGLETQIVPLLKETRDETSNTGWGIEKYLDNYIQKEQVRLFKSNPNYSIKEFLYTEAYDNIYELLQMQYKTGILGTTELTLSLIVNNILDTLRDPLVNLSAKILLEQLDADINSKNSKLFIQTLLDEEHLYRMTHYDFEKLTLQDFGDDRIAWLKDNCDICSSVEDGIENSVASMLVDDDNTNYHDCIVDKSGFIYARIWMQDKEVWTESVHLFKPSDVIKVASYDDTV